MKTIISVCLVFVVVHTMAQSDVQIDSKFDFSQYRMKEESGGNSLHMFESLDSFHVNCNNIRGVIIADAVWSGQSTKMECKASIEKTTLSFKIVIPILNTLIYIEIDSNQNVLEAKKDCLEKTTSLLGCQRFKFDSASLFFNINIIEDIQLERINRGELLKLDSGKTYDSSKSLNRILEGYMVLIDKNKHSKERYPYFDKNEYNECQSVYLIVFRTFIELEGEEWDWTPRNKE